MHTTVCKFKYGTLLWTGVKKHHECNLDGSVLASSFTSGIFFSLHMQPKITSADYQKWGSTVFFRGNSYCSFSSNHQKEQV